MFIGLDILFHCLDCADYDTDSIEEFIGHLLEFPEHKFSNRLGRNDSSVIQIPIPDPEPPVE